MNPLKAFMELLNLMFKSLLELFYGLFGNYGLSLVALSLAITVIMLPLFWIAEKIQNNNKKKRKEMDLALMTLDDVENRQEKYYYTRQIYKIYNYHPVYSLSSLIGLLIQIPFFIAAYQMLGHYTGFSSVSFGPISDLSVPDGLLGGINLLPVIMTAVNLLSGYFYSRSMNKSERIQLFVIAGLFLVLLYNQPAALVFYWTMNNFFSIGKNWLLKRFEKSNKLKKTEAKQKNPEVKPVSFFYKNFFIISLNCILVIVYLAIACFFGNDVNSRQTVTSNGILIIFMFLFCVYLLYILMQSIKRNGGRINQGNSNNAYKNIISTILVTGFEMIFAASLGLAILLTIERLSIYHFYIRLIIMFLLSVNICGFLYLTIKKTGYFSEKSDKQKTIEPLPVIEIVLFLFLYTCLTPLFIFFSSPDDFGGNNSLIFLYVVKNTVFLALLLFSVAFFLKRKRMLISKVLIVLVFTGIIFGYIYQKDLGIMRAFKFVNEGLLNVNTAVIIIDILVLCAVSILVHKFFFKFRKIILIAITVVFLSQSVILIKNINKYYAIQSATEVKELDNIELIRSDMEKNFSFSKTDNNILILLLDGFPGFLMNNLLEKHPEYRNQFSGFTWYPNTVASGCFTFPSMPSVIKGHSKLMDKLNGQSDKTFGEKYNETLMEHSEFFKKQGYSRVYHSIPYFTAYKELEEEGASFISSNDLIKYRKHFVTEYETDYAKEAFSIDTKDLKKTVLKSSIINKLTLFKLMPYLYKNIIYKNGFVSVSEKKSDRNYIFLKYRITDSFWTSFPQLVNSNSTSPTIKWLRTTAMNRPYHINAQEGPTIEESQKGGFDTNGSTEAIMTIEYEFKRLNKVFEKMKELGIYDNTTIFLVADHGVAYRKNWHDSAINALLMIKEKNQQGPLRISDKLMSNADVYAISTHVATGVSDDIIDNPLLSDKKRTVKYFATKHGDKKDMEKNYIKIDSVRTVSDTIIGKYEWPLSFSNMGNAIFRKKKKIEYRWQDKVVKQSKYVESVKETRTGLVIKTKGRDPYLYFKPVAVPEMESPFYVHIKLDSENASIFQFYYKTSENSSFSDDYRFTIPTKAGINDLYFELPPIFNGTFRIDPDNNLSSNKCIIKELEFRN